MVDLAKHVRIYDASPDDAMVTKRAAAIKEAIAAFRKNNNTPALVALGAAVASSFVSGVAPEPLGSIVATALKKQASSFVREERELEVAVVGAVAVLEMLEGPDTASTLSFKDVLTATLWSALSFQSPSENPKHEDLRQELLTFARDRTLVRSEASRKRTAPKEIPDFAEGDVNQMAKSLAAAQSAIATLTDNAALDREEMDILWWAMGSRSPITAGSYSAMNTATRSLVRGFELGILVRRVPSQSMRSLALTGIGEADSRSLTEMLDLSKDALDLVSAKIPGRSVVEAHPIAFPLLSAVISRSASVDGYKRTTDDWCARAVLEAGLAALCETPNSRL